MSKAYRSRFEEADGFHEIPLPPSPPIRTSQSTRQSTRPPAVTHARGVAFELQLLGNPRTVAQAAAGIEPLSEMSERQTRKRVFFSTQKLFLIGFVCLLFLFSGMAVTFLLLKATHAYDAGGQERNDAKDVLDLPPLGKDPH